MITTINPFETITAKLEDIETALRDLKQQTKNERPTKEAERLLNVKEAAKFLDLKVPTVYSKVSKGELPYMKRGKRLYFTSAELLNHLKKGRVKTVDEIELEADNYFTNLKKGLKA